MKKLSVIIACLTFGLLSLNVQAHGFQHNRFGSYIGISFSNSFSYPSYSSHYYPSNSLIGGISYRNYNSRIGLHNRMYSGRNNGRYSTNRVYQSGFQNGYRNGYRNGFTDASRIGRDRDHVNNNYRDGYRRYSSSCLEGYYDRYGNYAERSLPASACRR